MSTDHKPEPAIMRVKKTLQSQGFSLFGFDQITQPKSLWIYDDWIKKKQHADMGYLEQHLPLKKSLTQLMAQSQSVISVAVNYIPHPEPSPSPISSLKVARYAQGKDYHFWLKSKLEVTCQLLKDQFPHHEFLCYTDSKPVLERDFAQQLGMGWTGKNNCLIHPKKGSFFLLGEIVTSMGLSQPEIQVIPDMCGKCQRCIEACPTQAINDNRTIDSNKCISYWTIEAKTIPPPTLYKNFSGWFFGCDICQQVCPWNEKAFGKSTFAPPKVSTQSLCEELTWVLSSSNKHLMKSLHNSPLTRSRGFGLKRNALIVIENLNLHQMRPFLENYQPENQQLKDLTEQVLKTLN